MRVSHTHVWGVPSMYVSTKPVRRVPSMGAKQDASHSRVGWYTSKEEKKNTSTASTGLRTNAIFGCGLVANAPSTMGTLAHHSGWGQNLL